MASFFPQTFRDISVIQLNNITIVDPSSGTPSTGTVLTVSSGKAYTLPITFAINSIPSLSTAIGAGASNWALYPANSTINAASTPVIGVSRFAFST